jgi:hypothetical protein
MGGLHVLLGATTHVLRPHRVPRQTPHTLGRALGLLASAFALVTSATGRRASWSAAFQTHRRYRRRRETRAGVAAAQTRLAE